MWHLPRLLSKILLFHTFYHNLRNCIALWEQTDEVKKCLSLSGAGSRGRALVKQAQLSWGFLEGRNTSLMFSSHPCSNLWLWLEDFLRITLFPSPYQSSLMLRTLVEGLPLLHRLIAFFLSFSSLVFSFSFFFFLYSSGIGFVFWEMGIIVWSVSTLFWVSGNKIYMKMFY